MENFFSKTENSFLKLHNTYPNQTPFFMRKTSSHMQFHNKTATKQSSKSRITVSDSLKIRPSSMYTKERNPKLVCSNSNIFSENDKIRKENPLLNLKNKTGQISKKFWTQFPDKNFINLKNTSYLKTFYFAYENKIKDSTILGVSSQNITTISKHLEPELYKSYLKTKVPKIFSTTADKKNWSLSRIRNSSSKISKNFNKNDFFVILSSNVDDKVPIIHSERKKNSLAMKEFNVNKEYLFSKKMTYKYKSRFHNKK